MNFNTLKFNKEIILTGMILSLVAVLFIPFPWLGIGLMISILIITVLKEKDIILFTIFSFLVISSNINETLRFVSNSGIILILLYLFIKKYGFKVSSYPRLPGYIFRFILFLICLMFLSSLFSDSISIGLISTARQVIFFIIWFMLFSYLNEEKDIFKYAGALIISGFAISLSIIYSFFSSKELFLLETQGLVHEGGIYSNVTAAGGILDVTIPLTFALIIFHTKNIKMRFILVVLILVQLSGLFFTNSRESILAVVISCSLLLFILKRKIFYRVYGFSILSFILLFITSSVFSNLIEVYFRVNRILENTRYHLWEMTFRVIKDNPIWGVGPEQFKSQMYNYLNVMLGSWDEKQINWVYSSSGLGESHNFILFRTVELGLGGFISAILLPVIFIYYSILVVRSYSKNKKVYYLAAGIFSIGVGLFVRSFFEATGLLSHGWISRDLPFWLCFAIIIFLYNRRHIYVNRIS